jgi:serine/threonine protein kinase
MSQLESAGTMQTCPKCGTVTDTANAQPLTDLRCPRCGQIIRAERTFDHFTLLETLGSGGMATVYKARDTVLGRLVALKVVRRDLGIGVDRTLQLQQEARAAAAINHPNVVQVFSSGVDHGEFYVVMELVEHGSLDDLVEQQKRVPEQRILATGIQIANGLRAAQSKGLIHRDIKPANILFADERTAKIGDFGLAGVAAQTAETRGEIWGTPYYVAPERLDRQVEDFRSDIYSLGATLYHALAGRAPINAETTSASELRRLKQQPLDLRRIAPDVSAMTAEVLQRMIAPVPTERFASYDQLIQQLECALKPPTDEHKIEAPPHAKTVRWIPAISALVLIAIAIAVFVRVPKHNIRPPDRALAQHSGKQQTPATVAAQGPTAVPWEAALASYKQHIALYDFAGARASIQAAQVSGRSSLKSQQRLARIAQWLIDWKEKLISDLNRKQFQGAFTDRSGVQYTGIAGANSEQLMLKTRYGVIGTRWPTLAPNILLAVSASFISRGARDVADRQWLCAVFASQTAQIEEARQFAEAAGKVKSKYRRNIDLLLSPKS